METTQMRGPADIARQPPDLCSSVTGDATHQCVDLQVAEWPGSAIMEGELQRTVGRNLRAYRLQRGLSQEAFAEVLGVHRTYMGGLERGERNLTLKSLERLAAAVGIDPLDLLRQ